MKKRSLFSDMEKCHTDKISEAKTCNYYKKGHLLFHEGTRPMGVFCVYSGKIKVYKLGADGKEQIVTITKQGDVLGYKALISDELYPVSAETLEDANICFIPKRDFLETLNESMPLQQKLMRSVCRQVGVLTEQLTTLAQKSVRQRVAVTLLMLKDTYGMDLVDNGPIEINLTREDMANIVGTATETLIRLLADFKEDNLIAVKGRKIEVLDSKELARVAGIA
jgi:CRP-like cAMP-binding protein